MLIDPQTSFALELYQWAQITDFSAGEGIFSFEISDTTTFEFECGNSIALEDLFVDHDTDVARCYRWHDPTGGLPEELDFGANSTGVTITDPKQPGVVICSFSWLMIPEADCWGKSRSDGSEQMDLFGFKATGLPFVVECDSFSVLTGMFASARKANPATEKEKRKRKKDRKKQKGKRQKQPKQKKAGTGRKSSSATAVGGSASCFRCEIIQDPTASLGKEMLLELGKFGMKFTEPENKVVKLLYQWAQLSAFKKKSVDGFTFTVDVGYPAVPHIFEIAMVTKGANTVNVIDQLFQVNHQNTILCYTSGDPTSGLLPDEICLQGTPLAVEILDPNKGHSILFSFAWGEVCSSEVISCGGGGGGGRNSMDKFVFVTPEGGAGSGGGGQWRFEIQCEAADAMQAMFSREGESVSTGRERQRKQSMQNSLDSGSAEVAVSRKSTRSIEAGGTGGARPVPRKEKEPLAPPPPPKATPAEAAVKPPPSLLKPPPAAAAAAAAAAQAAVKRKSPKAMPTVKAASPPKDLNSFKTHGQNAVSPPKAVSPPPPLPMKSTFKVGPDGERELVIKICTWNMGNRSPKVEEVVERGGGGALHFFPH
jgi:hypothetical protein